MSDDRYSFLHMRDEILPLVDDDFFVQLPDDDVGVPVHLIPPFQGEDDNSILPANNHPSYPFGNPYSTSSIASNSNFASRTNAFSQSTRNLSTTLSSLSRPNFSMFNQEWDDLAADELLGAEDLREANEEMQSGAREAGLADPNAAHAGNEGAQGEEGDDEDEGEGDGELEDEEDEVDE